MLQSGPRFGRTDAARGLRFPGTPDGSWETIRCRDICRARRFVPRASRTENIRFDENVTPLDIDRRNVPVSRVPSRHRAVLWLESIVEL